MSTIFETRSQDGQCQEHLTIEEAIESFLSYDGYRLSIYFDETSFHIHRDELPIADKDKKLFFELSVQKVYDSKVVVYQPAKESN